MQSRVDSFQKQYAEISYPKGKEDRAKLLSLISGTQISNLEDRARCAQIIMDILGDQTALYETLDDALTAPILSWVTISWDEIDNEYIDLLISIVVHLEPSMSREFLSRKLNETSNTAIKELIEDGLSEL